MSDVPAHRSRSNALADLAARIRAEHEAFIGLMRKGLERAIKAGDLLHEAKAQLAHGEWLQWLSEHCEISERTAQLYMRLSKHAPELRSNTKNLADLTVTDAVQLLTRPQAGEPEACADETPALDLGDLSVMQFVVLKLWRIDSRIRLHPTGMQLPDDLSFEQWLAVGKVLRELPISEPPS